VSNAQFLSVLEELCTSSRSKNGRAFKRISEECMDLQGLALQLLLVVLQEGPLKGVCQMTAVSSTGNAEGKAIKNGGKPTGDNSDGVVVVRPTAEIMSRQQLPYYVGISEVTAGAKNISMNLIIIPPGGAAEPHLHKGYETAIYLLKGRVDTRYGQNLENSLICQEGDFIYINADVPHQPVNLSVTESVVALVARNDANEQEHVVTYMGKESNESDTH
jgi:uncharacterized RmlC-like cupin family protein